ncbi:MAG TPA: glutamine--fructose-6-phosphate transaminase (isomerizing) [Longimicrobiales bacterium]|nr:glutamine--fructose-6-phosphate transaminase (isomerizing) [Longimicrobiales bacterium]
MCGIVGYIGDRPAVPLLLEGLKRLEYRGYDSAGLTLVNGDGLDTRKAVGKIAELEKQVGNGRQPDATIGIAHTRWATHGAPNERNAHPHLSCNGEFAVVHNGIIENAGTLRKKLEQMGHTFRSETDTEVIAHLIEEAYEGNLEDAVREALRQVEGAYGLAIVSSREPRKIVAARKGSPLLLGVTDNGEYFVASDVAAVLAQTRQVIYLDDGEMAVLTDDGYETQSLRGESLEKEVKQIAWDLDAIEKSGHDHFMIKEIFEQPETIMQAYRGRVLEEDGTVKFGGLNLEDDELAAFDRIIICACGTSWHSGLIGEYMLEEICRLPVDVEYASEFRYRSPIVNERTLMLVISQSGETADTLAAMREAKAQGAKVLGIVNVVGSTIAREAHGGIYLHAGPEIGVASTKAFTSQVVALTLFTVRMGRLRGNLTAEQGREILQALRELPDKVEQVLELNDAIRELARIYKSASNFLYLGRGYNFPTALEGALKLKEISYIHAEGLPAAEMKHGPIALIDENMPVVVIAPHDAVYQKVLSNIQEVKARGGRVIAVATTGNSELAGMVDHMIPVPDTIDMLTPIVTTIPLQLLAYHIAVMRGCNVDMPRNLAKSVTVE